MLLQMGWDWVERTTSVCSQVQQWVEWHNCSNKFTFSIGLDDELSVQEPNKLEDTLVLLFYKLQQETWGNAPHMIDSHAQTKLSIKINSKTLQNTSDFK